MNIEQALAEVHRHFCSKDGAHDDACVALREALPWLTEANRPRVESAETAVLAALALADRADARADVDRRLITTAALRAALLISGHPQEPCIAPRGNLCTEAGCWDADRCVVLCSCGKPAAHTNAPEDSAEWACRVPNFDPQTGRILGA